MSTAHNEWFSGPRYATPVADFAPVTGFLPKLHHDYPWIPRPHRPESAQALTAWHEESVVVLLGEAGMGKSFELRRWFDERKSAGKLTDYIELQTESDDNLTERWKQRDIINHWLGGIDELELFLDGLDEFPAGARRLIAALNSFIQGTKTRKLRLRMTSRPGGWTKELERIVKTIASNENACILSLLPLEESDALEAAQRLGVADPTQFLEWVQERKADALASRPLTLRMLCDAITSGQQPTTSRAELFDRYLHRLFRGHQEEIRERALTAPQRVEVASRIAAATVFSNRPLIVDFDQNFPSALSIDLEDIVGGEEGSNASRVSVNRSALQETIETGPFARFDHKVFLWSSRTYEEYLGARYLAKRLANISTLDAVIINSTDPQRRTVPALRGTIGWLADLKPEVWHELARRDPRALLEAEPTARSSEDRSFLVEAWLNGVERKSFTANSHDLSERLAFLAHDKISVQLNKWLDIAQHQRDTICAAAYLAGVTGASGSTAQLVCLIENRWEADTERVAARYAFSALQRLILAGHLSPEVQAQIIELCRRVINFNELLDPDDNLLGYALNILWPKHISTDELLPALRFPFRRSHFGSYQLFYLHRFPQEVETHQLPAAIQWAVGLCREEQSSEPLETLAIRAATQPDNPELLCLLLSIILDDYLSFKVTDELRATLSIRAGRTDFIRTALEIDSKGSPYVVARRLMEKLGLSMHMLLDGAWAGLIESADPKERLLFAKAVSEWTEWSEEASVSRLLTEGPKHPELADALIEIRKLGDDPISIVKECLRRRDKDKRRWEKPKRKPQSPNPPIAQQIQQSISCCLNGDASAFLRLLSLLQYNPTKESPEFNWHLPIWEAYGWKAASDEQRLEITKAARAFLEFGDPEVNNWLGKKQQQVSRPFMGIAAVWLLYKQGQLTTLSDDVLARWASAVVNYENHFNADDESTEEIISFFTDRVPRSVADTWVAEFEGEVGRTSPRAFKKGWSPVVRDAFVAALRRQTDPQKMGTLLVELLRKNVDAANSFANQGLAWLDAPPDTLDRERGRQVVFALLHSESRNSVIALDYLESHEGDAREILIHLGENILLDKTLIVDRTVTVVGRFAELLARHFNPSDDPDFGEVRWMGPDDNIREQRDRCLKELVHLAETDGWAAVDELTRLERAFPNWKQVAYQRMAAVERAGESTWSPLHPTEVLRIIREGIPDVYINEARRRLEQFLSDRFSDGELRMFVRRLPQGISLETQLVGALASRAQLASSVVEVLSRANRLNKEMFQQLFEVRSHLADELLPIAEMLKLDIAAKK